MSSAAKRHPRRRIPASAWTLFGIALTVLGTIIVALINKWPMPGQQLPTYTAVPAAAAAIITPTPTPVRTDTPSPTATPDWLARITYPALSDVPVMTTRFIDLIGEYRPSLTDDIWIFVHDPNGRYYAESMEPCTGQSTPKTPDGRWEIYFGVGVDDSQGLYEVVLTTATPAASLLIANDLREGCRTGSYSSYVDLPPEVTEQQRVKAIRQRVDAVDARYQPMPPIPDAGLDGVVSVSAFGSDGRVSNEEVITGTTSARSTAVWALVYTYYGRWYPQSLDPCTGKHVERTEDRWRTKAIFGGSYEPDMPFYLAMVLADEQAGAFFDQKQREFCAVNHYPGFLTIELPAGISLKYSTRVVRR